MCYNISVNYRKAGKMMKNKIFRLSITISTVIVVLFNITFFVIDSFFYNIDNLPVGEFLFSSMSPTGDYTLKMYSVYGGETLGNAIRGEIVSIENGKVRNVYWQSDEKTAVVSWLSDSIVNINNNNVDVANNINYDWRDKFGPSELPVNNNF